MQTLSFWSPEMTRYTVGFGVASLIACVVYWGGFVQAAKRLWLAQTCVGIALFGGIFLVSSLGQLADGVDPTPPTVLWATVIFSPLQGLFERKRHATGKWYSYWLWSVGMYVGTGLVGGLTNRAVEEVAMRRYPSSPPDVEHWLWLNPGFSLGLALAPLSISFYRWSIPYLRLRPGFDRSLRADEEVPE